ncbi:AMP-binding protein [Iodidimonas sp. SYSU 1G8]|uniref:class I adenylate-forming enzyme family protein n=1 Tax=Iodidimonas sp. SYSU 1G8 TaxID=3133967 RepID=UPI0031FE93B6
MTQPINAFGRLLVRAAATWPDRDAVIFPERKQSFAELHRRSVLRAKQLVALGVRPGEHVGLLLPTSFEFLEVMFGIALAGAVMVPINARYRGSEIAYVTENADLVTIVTTGKVADGVDFIERLGEGLPGLSGAADAGALSLPSAPMLRNILLLGGERAAGFVAEAELHDQAAAVPDGDIDARVAAVGDDDLAMILYTSGTTSNPKGCMITGRSIIGNGRAMAKAYGMTEADSFWSPLPMFHIAATFPICACFDMGSAYVTMGYFDAGVALKLLESSRATINYACFVTIISDLINHPDFASTDLSAVRLMNSSLAVQPPGFAQRLREAMPQCIQVGTYGLSEASGTVCTSPLDSPEHLRHTRLGSPMPGQEVEIRDPDTGAPVPVGQRGEICVRGVNILQGYYKDPEKTAQTLRGGWLHTGDIGSLDEHGTIMFHGRFKDMLKVGGENVAAAEIESLLQEHPAVKLAQVVGLPDARLVEVPAAFVELKPGEQLSEADLIAFCKGKVASFKVPRHVRFVTAWPMSTSKIQKFKMRQKLEAELDARRGAAE